MSDSETDEVDPEELSRESVEELVSKDAIDEDEVEKFANNIWFDEIETGDIKQTGVREYLKRLVENFNFWFFKSSTIFGEVQSVEKDSTEMMSRRVDNNILLKVFHGAYGSMEFKLSPGGTHLAHLLECKSVEDPRELEGERVPIRPSSGSISRSHKLLIPHNVSKSGILRFRVHSLLSEFVEKTTFEHTTVYNTVKKTYSTLFLASLIWAVVGVEFISATPETASPLYWLPFTLLASVGVLNLVRGFMRHLADSLSDKLDSEFLTLRDL